MTPRHDFNTVTRFTPPSFDLEPPQNDVETALQSFDKQTVLLQLALEALATSLARYEGASALRKHRSTKYISEAYIKSRARAELNQADAVIHNATQCADLADSLVRLRTSVNDAWRQLNTEATRNTADSLATEEVGKRFAAQWQANMMWFQKSFHLNPFQMTDVMQQVDRMLAEQRFAAVLPETLLDETWRENLQAFSAQLRALSVSFASLNTALQNT